MPKKRMRLAVLTGGGDCPGLNAVIRAVTKTALLEYDMEVVGFKDGFEGLLENRYLDLDYEAVSGILTRGGTILGTSNRADPFNYPMLEGGKMVYRDRSDQAMHNFENLGLDALVCIGGDGTMAAAARMMDKGLPVVGVPKTIDNDLFGTDVTFGYDSAVATGTEAIDRLHTTAQSHHRVMVVEVMGRYAGWLALAIGIAGGGDIILIPEIPYDIDIVCERVRERNFRGSRFSILVVAEAAAPKGGKMVVRELVEGSPDKVRLGGIGSVIAKDIEQRTKVETRVTVLGHLLRGGVPTAYDRILATRFGVEAVRMVVNGQFGHMVGIQGGELKHVPIKEVGGRTRKVPLDSPLIMVARSVGTCLGD
ncbi:MAG: ATP-dependent 6-phosphofructokinase [candidate division KSB1 bacterium]|nr:ATP-dependent 6-phosphofructokinase [candidate division KSB1 bacterium]